MELPGELDPEQKLLPRDDACMRDKKGERERERENRVSARFRFLANKREREREKKGRGKERKDDVTSTVTQRIT